MPNVGEIQHSTPFKQCKQINVRLVGNRMTVNEQFQKVSPRRAYGVIFSLFLVTAASGCYPERTTGPGKTPPRHAKVLALEEQTVIDNADPKKRGRLQLRQVLAKDAQARHLHRAGAGDCSCPL